MKACVLYSGGKDSSLMASILDKLGFDVELITANFGVYDSNIPAALSAKSLNFKHIVLKLDKNILKKSVDLILDDGFPNNGINYLHKEVIEEVAMRYPVVSDGTRRDDKTPKLTKNQIQSLEDRKNVQYINLDGFGFKTIDTLVKELFIVDRQKSNMDNNSDYEVEIRCLIEGEGISSENIFPEHYQTRVIGFKDE